MTQRTGEAASVVGPGAYSFALWAGLSARDRLAVGPTALCRHLKGGAGVPGAGLSTARQFAVEIRNKKHQQPACRLCNGART